MLTLFADIFCLISACQAILTLKEYKFTIDAWDTLLSDTKVLTFLIISCVDRNGPLLTCQDFEVLMFHFKFFWKNTINSSIFCMTSCKSHHVRKTRIIWEQKRAPSAVNDPKITKKNARTTEKTVLKPVATGPLPETVEFDADHLPELPVYILSLDL